MLLFKRDILNTARFMIVVARAGFTTTLTLLTGTEQSLFSLFTLCSALPQQEKLLGRLFGPEGPRGSAAWEDASVRSAWLKGVHSMLHHLPALHCLCSTGECCWGCPWLGRMGVLVYLRLK